VLEALTLDLDGPAPMPEQHKTQEHSPVAAAHITPTLDLLSLEDDPPTVVPPAEAPARSPTVPAGQISSVASGARSAEDELDLTLALGDAPPEPQPIFPQPRNQADETTSAPVMASAEVRSDEPALDLAPAPRTLDSEEPRVADDGASADEVPATGVTQAAEPSLKDLIRTRERAPADEPAEPPQLEEFPAEDFPPIAPERRSRTAVELVKLFAAGLLLLALANVLYTFSTEGGDEDAVISLTPDLLSPGSGIVTAVNAPSPEHKAAPAGTFKYRLARAGDRAVNATLSYNSTQQKHRATLSLQIVVAPPPDLTPEEIVLNVPAHLGLAKLEIDPATVEIDSKGAFSGSIPLRFYVVRGKARNRGVGTLKMRGQVQEDLSAVTLFIRASSAVDDDLAGEVKLQQQGPLRYRFALEENLRLIRE
jgi:hypothetical protein